MFEIVHYKKPVAFILSLAKSRERKSKTLEHQNPISTPCVWLPIMESAVALTTGMLWRTLSARHQVPIQEAPLQKFISYPSARKSSAGPKGPTRVPWLYKMNHVAKHISLNDWIFLKRSLSHSYAKGRLGCVSASSACWGHRRGTPSSGLGGERAIPAYRACV